MSSGGSNPREIVGLPLPDRGDSGGMEQEDIFLKPQLIFVSELITSAFLIHYFCFSFQYHEFLPWPRPYEF